MAASVVYAEFVQMQLQSVIKHPLFLVAAASPGCYTSHQLHPAKPATQILQHKRIDSLAQWRLYHRLAHRFELRLWKVLQISAFSTCFRTQRIRWLGLRTDIIRWVTRLGFACVDRVKKQWWFADKVQIGWTASEAWSGTIDACLLHKGLVSLRETWRAKRYHVKDSLRRAENLISSQIWHN